MNFSKFVKMRYDDTPGKAQDFCDIIAAFTSEKDPDAALATKGKYSTVIDGLVAQLIAEGEIKGSPEV